MPSSAELVRAGIVLIEHGCEREALTVLDYVRYPSGTLAGDYYLALALAHRNLGNFPQALEAFTAGIAYDPGSQQLKFGRALLYLTLGRWGVGWPDYEIRKALQAGNGEGRGFSFPALGRDDIRHPLFIYGEQGLGDEIMFAGTIEWIFRDRPKVIECAPELVKLFTRSFPDAHVLARNLSRDPRFYKLPTWDRPFREIASGSIPFHALSHGMDWFSPRPYLAPDPERVARYRALMKEYWTAEQTIGISWTGGTKFTRRAARSMSLDAFMAGLRPIFPKAHFISLQHDATQTSVEIHNPHFNDAFGDLDDTAALISACDLVVSVCNTNVHLAGALGVPCYCLAPYVPEWRYGLNDFMPWYGSVEICRQKKPGDWADCFKSLQASARVDGFAQ